MTIEARFRTKMNAIIGWHSNELRECQLSDDRTGELWHYTKIQSFREALAAFEMVLQDIAQEDSNTNG